MITAKKALETLVSAGIISDFKKVRYDQYGNKTTGFNVTSDVVGVSDETYGKKSFLYFRCNSKDVANKVLNELVKVGATPETGWNGGIERGCLELQVSNFKGNHWWQ